jgi:hypothetical protein
MRVVRIGGQDEHLVGEERPRRQRGQGRLARAGGRGGDEGAGIPDETRGVDEEALWQRQRQSQANGGIEGRIGEGNLREEGAVLHVEAAEGKQPGVDGDCARPGLADPDDGVRSAVVDDRPAEPLPGDREVRRRTLDGDRAAADGKPDHLPGLPLGRSGCGGPRTPPPVAMIGTKPTGSVSTFGGW